MDNLVALEFKMGLSFITGSLDLLQYVVLLVGGEMFSDP